MNKKRRNKIVTIIEDLTMCKTSLHAILCDEENTLDSIPENLQNSINYEIVNENVELLEKCCDALDDIIDDLREI